MKIRNRHLRGLRYIAPVFCSIAVLSTQLQASPTIQLNGDESRDGMADSGNLGYVGGNTRIGVSIDRELQGQVDINQIIHEDDSSATSAEGWFGYKIKDDDNATKGFQGGGVKLNHQWVNDSQDSVHKVFGAYDRNTDDQAKATLGYGQETEDLFWSGHVSKGMGDDVTNGDVTSRSYDYGVGGEVGTFIDSTLTRIRGGLDYEFGTDFADDEERPGQLTVSAGVEQFFHDTPHSISLDISGNQKQGGNDAENNDFNARLGYRYEFGGNGAFQSEQTSRRRRVEIPGTPGRPGRAGVAAIPPTPATAGTPGRPGRAAVPAKYERRAVQTPGHKFVKTTMKLENETFFKLNSSALTDSAMRNLDKIVSQIRGHGYLGAIRITGNTCGMGDPVYDQRLSENRANAVRDYMIEQGFNPEHMIARGLGKGSPKYDRSDNDFKNRRVDLEYVTERSTKKQANKTQYKNVLVQEGRPAIPAQPARPGRAGHPGRPAIPAIAATPGTPSRFVWKTEGVKSAPIWIKRALRNTIRHNKTISTYTTRASQKVADDSFSMTSRDGLIDVLNNDSAGVTLVRVSQPANGSVVIEGNKVRYIPNPGYSGADSFTYTVSDRDGNEITATVNVDVPVAMNNIPTTASDIATTNENTIVLIDVLDNDSDPDGDTLVIESTTAPANGSVRIVAGQVEYTPNTGFYGTDTFSYTVNDGNGNVSTATVTVNVSDVNEAPKATDDAVSTPENTPVTIDAVDNDTDADGDPLVITAVGSPSNGQVAIVNNTIVYTPNTGYFGTDSFTYTITDNQGHDVTANVTVNVTDVNVTPVAGDDMRTTPENTPVTVSVLDNDSDADGDTLTITGTTNPANGSVSVVDDEIVYTPNTDYSGNDSFEYTISDGQGHSETAIVEIIITDVNMTPSAVDDTRTTPENTPVTVSVLDNDSDPDGDTLTITGTTNPANGSASVVDDEIVYTPDTDYSGNDSFEYTISDGQGHSETATVEIIITDVNMTPSAVDDTRTTPENTPVTVSVLDNDSDPDGDTLTITGTTNPANGSVSIVDDEIVYTPNTDYSGNDRFEYTISDGQGHSETATVNIVITEVNMTPKATDDSESTNQDTPVTVSVLTNDTDPDGDSLSITGATSPLNGVVSVSGDDIIYTPNAGFSGTDIFDYSITDGQGNNDTASVVVTVDKVNASPVAVDDVRTTEENTPVTVSVLGNDNDPDGDTLTITGATTPANGSVSVSGDDIVYTPNTDYSGNDTFDYTITDNNGHTETATVTIMITDVNMPPMAVNDSRTTDENVPVTVDVLTNDSDPEGDNLSITDVGTPSNGTASISGGNIVYTPATDYVGTDSFDYTITDTSGNEVTATVNITINNVNQPPKLTNDVETTVEDTAITIDVTANDSDPDGDTLTVTGTSDPSNGTVSVTGNNAVYTPASGYVGPDSFTYTVNDGNGHSETATVDITVTGTNKPPVAVNDVASVPYETATTIPVSANDTDPEGGPTCVSAISTDPTSGWVSIAGSGTDVIYTPFDGFSGTDSFVYLACDSEGNTTPATVNVTVGANPNLPPILSPNYAAIQGYGSVPIRVLADDSDPEGDTLTILRIENGPANGTATITGDRIYYQANDGFVGSDSFYYVVSDGNGNEGSARVDVDVKNDIAVNSDPVVATIPAFDAATGSTTPMDISSYITDPDGDSVYIAVADALGGSLTFSGTTLQYTPAEAKSGETDTIYITVSDGNGGMADSIVTVNVQ